jgi:AcrR family transcriptional regulator
MASTKDRILDAAEKLFAERGFHATSLRAITAAAGANLAAVNYHFTSKEALLHALFARRLGTLNRRRLDMLDTFEAEAAGRPVPLERLARALIEPVLRLGGSRENGGTGFGMLLGRMYSAPSGFPRAVFAHELEEVVGRFQSAFRRALPNLTEEELIWRLFFSIGAMAHTLAASDLLRLISRNLCDPADVDRAVEKLIVFVVAAMRAPAAGGIGKEERPGRPRRPRVAAGSNHNRKKRGRRPTGGRGL